jgi:hypothetical protein
MYSKANQYYGMNQVKTEIYTNVSSKRFDEIINPFDNIDIKKLKK